MQPLVTDIVESLFPAGQPFFLSLCVALTMLLCTGITAGIGTLAAMAGKWACGKAWAWLNQPPPLVAGALAAIHAPDAEVDDNSVGHGPVLVAFNALKGDLASIKHLERHMEVLVGEDAVEDRFTPRQQKRVAHAARARILAWVEADDQRREQRALATLSPRSPEQVTADMLRSLRASGTPAYTHSAITHGPNGSPLSA